MTILHLQQAQVITPGNKVIARELCSERSKRVHTAVRRAEIAKALAKFGKGL